MSLITETNKNDTLCFATGSEFPPLKPGVLRLYSMRFCPYSQRVRLVLEAKGIKYEIININIKRKPEWYTDVNALGHVPCLQHDDGRSIYESLIIIEYLDSIYPERKLISSDAYEKARGLMLIDGFQRVAALLYKALKFKTNESFTEIDKVLDSYEKILGDNLFYGGKQTGIVDYMIWPWFERFRKLKSLTKDYEPDKDRFPKIRSWICRMLQFPETKSTRSLEEQISEFYKMSLTNKEPDYDVGLEKSAEVEKPAAAEEKTD